MQRAGDWDSGLHEARSRCKWTAAGAGSLARWSGTPSRTVGWRPGFLTEVSLEGCPCRGSWLPEEEGEMKTAEPWSLGLRSGLPFLLPRCPSTSRRGGSLPQPRHLRTVTKAVTPSADFFQVSYLGD